MKFISTNSHSEAVDFIGAAMTGLAPDGGLFVPQSWPKIDWSDFLSNADELPENDFFQKVSVKILSPFFAGTFLEQQLPEICESAFNFDVPMVEIDNSTYLLELFHGPTSAFKDFGARFLGEVLNRVLDQSKKDKFVLVATSGDTGGAVASALSGKSRIQVAVLFPEKGVSPLQKLQLTCWGDNVHSFSVRGHFDDCQRMVKAAFSMPELQKTGRLTSANSINIGRLLPQMTYYAASSWRFYLKNGTKLSFVVPTGNMGNVVAALYARELGCPIDSLAISTNSNETLSHYFSTNLYREFSLKRTLANAMDVSSPSNFARFDAMNKQGQNIEIERCISVSDEQIKRCITEINRANKLAICPHTATAMVLRKELSKKPWCVVSTAHPAKFKDVVEPQIKRQLDWPAALAALKNKKCSFETIDAESESFCQSILGRFQ